jgi:signal transduction histidine kinase
MDIDARGLHVDARLDHAPARGDAHLLERLAANLIENAARYNVPSGEIEVTTEVRSGVAILRVANSGPIIPAADVARLFEPFRRVQSDRTAQEEGSGLGLSIVQAIASAHGGSVDASPREAGGLVVEVRIPSVAGAGRSSEKPVESGHRTRSEDVHD